MPSYKRPSITCGILAAATLTSALACSNAGKGDSQSASPTVASSENLGADLGKLSRIVITPKGRWVDLKGYVVGEPSHSALQTLADLGKPGFLNMSDGTYDVMLESKIVGADGNLSPAAIRISGVKITRGTDAQIRDVDLKPYITMSGKIELDGASSHAGIQVKIPGTTLQTTTATDGSFHIAQVPAGLHKLDYSHPGFTDGFIEKSDYRADTVLVPITLRRDSIRLESGVHFLGSPLSANSRKIVLQLLAPASMNNFRYGPTEDLSSSPWLRLQSSLELELRPGEQPQVFVQYALDERQLSPVFSVSIPVQY